MNSNTRRYLLTALISCIGCTIFAQSQTQAKKWFAEGEYEKAKPVFAKLVKSNPKSGSINYWYGVCLNETGEHDKALPYLKKAVDSDVENAYRYMGDYCLADGNYEEALDHYDTYLNKVDPTDTMFVVYTRRAERAKHELKFYKRVEKVVFVDSIVVAKEKFLEAYMLGRECGKINNTHETLGGNTSTEGTAYRTEMNDKIYYSDADANGRMQLYMCYKMLDSWSKPTALNGLPEGDNNYPFLLADGVTIYFANNNPNGLGGYDLYITRYNSDIDRYYMAENLGMPFNSPANDYMMVVDEVNNLGWFATDRNQPEGMVCIYTFIPTETKEYYNYKEDDFETIRKAAQIESIETTQTDEEAVRKALKAL
jgi:tetratricopeptide (TPR) repeat protein